MNKLTAAQEGVLSCIKSFIESHGYPPTRSEIRDLMGYKSTNASHEHLIAIERKGYLTLTKGISRGIQIPNKQPVFA